MLDQRVGVGVLEGRSQQLIGIIVAEIEALRSVQAGVILFPGRDLALHVVSIIELRDESARAVQVFDLLKPFVLRVGKISVVR